MTARWVPPPSASDVVSPTSMISTCPGRTTISDSDPSGSSGAASRSESPTGIGGRPATRLHRPSASRHSARLPSTCPVTAHVVAAQRIADAVPALPGVGQHGLGPACRVGPGLPHHRGLARARTGRDLPARHHHAGPEPGRRGRERHAGAGALQRGAGRGAPHPGVTLRGPHGHVEPGVVALPRSDDRRAAGRQHRVDQVARAPSAEGAERLHVLRHAGAEPVQTLQRTLPWAPPRSPPMRQDPVAVGGERVPGRGAPVAGGGLQAGISVTAPSGPRRNQPGLRSPAARWTPISSWSPSAASTSGTAPSGRVTGVNADRRRGACRTRRRRARRRHPDRHDQHQRPSHGAQYPPPAAASRPHLDRGDRHDERDSPSAELLQAARWPRGGSPGAWGTRSAPSRGRTRRSPAARTTRRARRTRRSR